LPTINIEIKSSLAPPFRTSGGEDAVEWQEEVAPGETLGRLLDRLIHQKPAFRSIYDPETKRVTNHVELVVNGRIYQLIGGLTYKLNDADTIGVLHGQAEEAG
jgi:molybdopterin converting factor small subunit